MKPIFDDDVDILRALAPEKRMALVLLWLFDSDVIDEGDYLYALEAALDSNEKPS